MSPRDRQANYDYLHLDKRTVIWKRFNRFRQRENLSKAGAARLLLKEALLAREKAGLESGRRDEPIQELTDEP